MDALSLPANQIGSAPKLLLHTVFTGMTLNVAGTYAQDSQDPSSNFYTPFSDATDSTTGFDLVNDIKTLWGSNTAVVVQSVPQSDILLADFGTWFDSTLTTNELSLKCVDRQSTTPGAGNPQSTLLAYRTAAQALADDIDEMCVMLYVKLPTGLDLQTGFTSSGKFYEIFEIKTGGYNNAAGVGDMRIKLELLGTNGVNEWVCTVDDRANGGGTVPGVTGSTVIFHRNYSGVEAALNTWTRCWIYFKRSTGRLVMAIQPDGGTFDVIGNVTSADLTLNPDNKLYGAAELPITRIFMGNNYTSATLPAPLLIKELQLWDKMPIKLV